MLGASRPDDIGQPEALELLDSRGVPPSPRGSVRRWE
jgi:hypothetical protein